MAVLSSAGKSTREFWIFVTHIADALTAVDLLFEGVDRREIFIM